MDFSDEARFFGFVCLISVIEAKIIRKSSSKALFMPVIALLLMACMSVLLWVTVCFNHFLKIVAGSGRNEAFIGC